MFTGSAEWIGNWFEERLLFCTYMYENELINKCLSFLVENENFFKLYLVVYSTPGSPRNSHLWQTAVTRLPSCISAKRRPTIRGIFLQLEYLALTNAASRSVAERKAGECLTSTSCCIQSTPPSLWTGQYSVVFCFWNATMSQILFYKDAKSPVSSEIV